MNFFQFSQHKKFFRTILS